MHFDRESYVKALETRDARFDGVFFVGIASTRIYCRPICPARVSLRKNRRFFSNAAAAERAGFRPCLRCRPELAPGLARVDAVTRLAELAARRIAAGALNGRGVDRLAGELGVSGRQLRRALQLELGVAPIELAQTHRLLLAKQLLTDTRLPVSQVAFASGFQSLRRFNALFRTRYQMNPESLRRDGSRAAGLTPSRSASTAERGDTVRLTLTCRDPFAWEPLLGFLAARAAPEVECVDGSGYMRTVQIDGHTGVIRVSRAERPNPRAGSRAATPALHLDVSAALMPVLMQVRAAVSCLFDLDAEPETIESHLVRAGIGPISPAHRGLRVPGAFDAFEVATRAILGQQVSVKGASTLMSRLTLTFGSPFRATHAALTRLPVSAASLANATVEQIKAIGLPLARATTIRTLAQQVASGALRIDPGADVHNLTKQLRAIAGIGPWTSEYIAMRAVHWPDAFPASDLVLCRSAGNLTSAQLLKAAERWRPWRAYAAMHLWARA